MDLSLYSPIAHHSMNIYLLLGLGGSVGFLSGLCGVGGGFIMTPLLIMFGIPPTVAAASDSAQIVASATSGAYAHYRVGLVDLKMGLTIFGGGIIGSTLGVDIIKTMREAGNVGFFIDATYVVTLGIVGSYMMVEAVRCLRRNGDRETITENPSSKISLIERVSRILPWTVEFEKSGIRISPVLPFLVGGFVGMVAAILGVGGGFIMIPVMCYILRMPIRTVVGTNLFQEVLVCANITIMQAVENQSVDLSLALIILCGSTVGAQFGARLGHRLKADHLKIILASVVLLVMAKILLGLILQPDILLNLKGGQ
jgi:uncharacterized membrane protein YfcA